MNGRNVGEQVSDVTAPLVLPAGETVDRSLSSLVEEAPVLLCFYTADFSPDCIEEWCRFRDFEWFGTTDTVNVVGVSKSRPAVHRRFIDRLNLGFPLYSDRDLSIADAFGVRYRVFGLLARSRRSCFLLDEELTIRYRWVGEHWLDPTRDVPPVREIFDGVSAEVGEPKTETFGFDTTV